MQVRKRFTFDERLAVGFLIAGVAGCASGTPQSTRLTAGDYRYTVDRTAAALASSDWIATRTATSPRAVVEISKVTNLTSDVIPEAEQWMFVRSVWQSEAVQQVIGGRNIATRVHAGTETLRTGELTSDVTHRLAAVFDTATRSGDVRHGVLNFRADYYQMEYTITEISTGTIVWSGLVEFKRAASGNVVD